MIIQFWLKLFKKKHKLSTHVAQCILPPVEPEVLVYEVEGDGDVAVPCPGGPQVSGYGRLHVAVLDHQLLHLRQHLLGKGLHLPGVGLPVFCVDGLVQKVDEVLDFNTFNNL